MTMTDPIADMLTRIRNAIRNHRRTVKIPKSRTKVGIAEVLKREGYIDGLSLVDEGIQGAIELKLKYGPDGELVMNRIERTSKPGRRVYSRIVGLKPILAGMGVSVLSTSQGILSDREARQRRIGGEVLCTVW